MQNLHETTHLIYDDYVLLETFYCETGDIYYACNIKFIGGNGSWVWTMEYISIHYPDIYLYIVQKYGLNNIVVTGHLTQMRIYEKKNN